MRSPYAVSVLLIVVFAALSAPAGARGRAPSAGGEAKALAWPKAGPVEAQPLLAQVRRLRQALDYLGSPLPADFAAAVGRLKPDGDAAKVTSAVEGLLDPLCLAVVEVANDGKLIVSPAARKPRLVEQGWRTLLVKVVNRSGTTGALRIDSPNARPLPHSPPEEVRTRWLDLAVYSGQPLLPGLGGLGLEYRLVQVFARDPGEHTAVLAFGLDGVKGDPGTGSVVRDWRFDKGAGGWEALNQCKLDAEKGALKVTSSGNDPYFVTDVEGKPGRYVLRFWAKFERGGVGQLFWRTKERGAFDGRRVVNFPIEAGRAREYEVRFRVEGNLAGLRLDPGSTPTVSRFDWISLAGEGASGPRSRAEVAFDVQRSVPVTFRVLEADGAPATAAFVIRDAEGAVYPAQSKRLAPDLFFQPQVYRATGEQVRLPAGRYTVLCSRGPESVPETKTIEVGNDPVTLVYQVRRWADPARRGWYSGDHHIHAAGCQHYDRPTEGVRPEDMIRYTLGEDLKVGCCLTWGPCFDFQKRFFTGKPDDVSKPPYLLRYDVEVSGFGSHNSGHLCLLNLKEQIPPGGESKHHWPTLGLNTLRWAKKQGAVCGPAHSGSGLTRFVGRTPGQDGPGRLPNFDLPAYDGIGANEFVIDVTHDVPGPDGKPVPAIDFISTMNTDRTAEWNMWYHVLNCGFRVKASGETDFPCVSGERVGLGRVYVKVEGKLDFARWANGLADGRGYVSDGTTHLWDFFAQSGGQKAEMGVAGSEMRLAKGGKATFTVKAQARLDGAPKVPVELVVNGYPVARQDLVADGAERELRFEADVARSSWIAVRARPRAHTNPVFVLVEGKPIRASADSAEWCLRGVEQCWAQKKPTYLGKEQKEAEAAYEHARTVYRRIKAEALAGDKKTGLLKLRLRDAMGGLMPARVHLYDAAGKPVRPDGLPFWRDHFVCAGQADLPLAPGEYRYEVERGPEYEPARGKVAVGDSTELEVRLARLSDLAAKGWYCGDLHIHRPPADVPLLMRAEDLHVGGVITWWNRQNPWATAKLPDPAVVRFDGRWCDLLGGEDERGGGALLYFRREAPLAITMATREHPSSLRYLREAKKGPRTWADVEKPFWWDVPAWLATGLVDSIGVAHNHMHRGGVMDSEAWGRPRDRERHAGVAGNGWWTQEIYYHMLNAGLRVPPSAGSASGVLPNPVGYNRVWVHTGKPLDPAGWWAGLKAGRSVVSNGPLLVARAAGELPGHVFREAGEIEIDVEVVSADPVRVVEVVQDGTVVKAQRVGKKAWKGQLGVRLERSGWLLVRAVADVPHTFRFASTAPWFVEAGDEPRPVSKRSAEFFHGWARQRRDALAKLVTDAGQRQEVLDDHDAAVRFWRDRLAKANRP